MSVVEDILQIMAFPRPEFETLSPKPDKIQEVMDWVKIPPASERVALTAYYAELVAEQGGRRAREETASTDEGPSEPKTT